MENFTDFVYSRLNRGLTQEKLFANNNLLHATLGLVGETQEALDARCTGEITNELGDVCFYLAMLERELGIDEDSIDVLDSLIGDDCLEGLLSLSIDLVECIKKYVFQERTDLLNVVKGRVVRFQAGLWNVCSNLDISIEQCKAACVKKLTARYPTQFTPELSKNRKVTDGNENI